MSKVYTVSELQNILSPIFQQNGVKQAILFGSYAKGVATAKSDIDLLVDSGLRGLAFFGLLEDVSVAIDAPVDLLDVSQIEKNSRIDREIRESGVAIYGEQRPQSAPEAAGPYGGYSPILPRLPFSCGI